MIRTYAPGKAYQNQYIKRGMIVPYTANVEGNPTATATGCVGLMAVPETGRVTPYEYSFTEGYYGSSWFYNGTFPDGTSWHFGGAPGEMTPYYTGVNYGSSFFAFDAMDGYREDYDTLRAGFERLNFSMFSNYDLNDNVTLYFDTFHNGFFSFDYGNESGYPYSTWALSGDQSFAPEFFSDNPYLTQSSVDYLASWGLPSFHVNKSHVDVLQKGDGGYTIENNNSVSMFSVGLEGNFDLNDKTYNFALGYSIGNTEIYSDAPGVIGARWAAALDVGINPETGEIDCRMNYDPTRDPALYDYTQFAPSYFSGRQVKGGSLLGEIGDCAPLNIFGRGAGS